MRQVVVASRTPTADELLAERLARGWRPIPTELQSGWEILGHAKTRCRAEDGAAICP